MALSPLGIFSAAASLKLDLEYLIIAGGGGATNSISQPGAAGGGGVVILKYAAGLTATFTGGVTQSTTTSNGFKISTITAAGVSDTVTFA